ncbi:Nep1 ribosome biogenesis protein [Cooperia oncophora]
MSEEYDTVAPPGAKKMKTDESSSEKRILYVVLEGCSLESAKVRTMQYLCSDKHANFLRKNKKDPADYRPDILHQVSCWYFSERNKNVLVRVSPQCRIPRTFDRFCGLMVQLLHKLVVRAADSSQKLLTVIKNPVSNYLPVGSRKILMTFNTEELVLPNKLISPKDEAPLVVVIGGIARGKIVTDYTDRDVKISNYPLSAALTCAKVTSGLEEIWGVI